MRQLALAFGVLSAAGTALAQPPAPRGNDHFPLTKGARWVYKVGENEVTVVVVGTERVKDEEWVRVETLVGKDVKAIEFYAVRADGVYRTKVKDEPLDPGVKVLPIPATAGVTWAVNSKFGGSSLKGTLAIKGEREKVKVPAGTFETVLVEGIDLDIAGARTTMRIWFARGRGIVREEFVLQGGEAVVLELVTFEPGETPPAPPIPSPGPTTAPEPAWAFPRTCRILPAKCNVLPVTTQENCGCCARSGRLWVRRR